MSNEFFTLLTNYGAAQEAASKTTNAAVQLVTLVIGDGNGNPVTPLPTTTALVNERYTVPIDEIVQSKIDPTIYTIIARVPPEIGGFTIREFGIKDIHGGLYFIGNADTSKPAADSGQTSDLQMDLIVKTQATVAPIVIDPNIITATRQWTIERLQEHIDSATPHPNLSGGAAADDVSQRLGEHVGRVVDDDLDGESDPHGVRRYVNPRLDHHGAHVGAVVNDLVDGNDNHDPHGAKGYFIPKIDKVTGDLDNHRNAKAGGEWNPHGIAEFVDSSIDKKLSQYSAPGGGTIADNAHANMKVDDVNNPHGVKEYVATALTDANLNDINQRLADHTGKNYKNGDPHGINEAIDDAIAALNTDLLKMFLPTDGKGLVKTVDKYTTDLFPGLASKYPIPEGVQYSMTIPGMMTVKFGTHPVPVNDLNSSLEQWSLIKFAAEFPKETLFFFYNSDLSDVWPALNLKATSKPSILVVPIPGIAPKGLLNDYWTGILNSIPNPDRGAIGVHNSIQAYNRDYLSYGKIAFIRWLAIGR